MTIGTEPIVQASLILEKKVNIDKEPISFEQRAMALYQRLGLTEVVPDIGKVVQDTQVFVETHSLSAEFLDDDVNLCLLLGCSQKLREKTDPRYRKRILDFEKRLISPYLKSRSFDPEELWGPLSSKGEMSPEEINAYVEEKTDPEATNIFTEKYDQQIKACKSVWAERGYDLDLRMHVVADDRMTFLKNVGGAAYIVVPDAGNLDPKSGKAVVDFVVLKDYSAERENMIRHELYHVVDYWGYVRRGHQLEILESLDELHTEHAVGNYKRDHCIDQNAPGEYFDLKQFWDKFSYTGDIDFDMLSDRRGLLDTLSANYGLNGLIDFCLLYAHASGRGTSFETFFREPERPTIDLLIAKESIRIRRAIKSGELEPLVAGYLSQTFDLSKNCIGSWSKSVYDLIPTEKGNVYSAKSNDRGSSLLENEKAKNIVIGYAGALAFADLYFLGQAPGQQALYEQVVQALGAVPHSRRNPEYSVDSWIENELQRARKYTVVDDTIHQRVVASLYIDLTQDMPGIDFAFSIQDPRTKDQLLDPFLKELSTLASFCLDHPNPNYVRWFVDGIYGYNCTTELRETSVDFLIQSFPQMAKYLEDKRSSFDPQKHRSQSF